MLHLTQRQTIPSGAPDATVVASEVVSPLVLVLLVAVVVVVAGAVEVEETAKGFAFSEEEVAAVVVVVSVLSAGLEFKANVPNPLNPLLVDVNGEGAVVEDGSLFFSS